MYDVMRARVSPHFPGDVLADQPPIQASTQSSATPSQGTTIARTPQIQASPSTTPSRANPHSLNVARTPSNTSRLSMHAVSVMPVSTPATGRITNREPGGSSLYPSPGRPLRSFGPSTQLTLQALGYGDLFHKVCRDVFDNFVAENWVSELAKRGLTDPDHAEQIATAMWDDCES